MQQERLDRILALLEEKPFLTVTEAAEILAASPATIRRDFNLLAEQQRLERARGGVVRSRQPLGELPPFAVRQVRLTGEKAALARKAVELLAPHDVVMVDGGTTTFHLTTCLPGFPLQIITNSLRLASTLAEKSLGESPVETYLTGGYLYPQSGLLVGPQAAKTLTQYHANWAFLSAGGVNEQGVFNAPEHVIEAERTMIEHADRVVVLADQTKIGARSMCWLCPLDRIHVLITIEWPGNQETIEHIRAAGVQVIEVSAPNQSNSLNSNHN